MVLIEDATYYEIDQKSYFALTFLTGKTKVTQRDFRANIKENSVRELYLICKYLCLQNYSKLNKNELINAILKSKGKKSKVRAINPQSGRCRKV